MILAVGFLLVVGIVLRVARKPDRALGCPSGGRRLGGEAYPVWCRSYRQGGDDPPLAEIQHGEIVAVNVGDVGMPACGVDHHPMGALACLDSLHDAEAVGLDGGSSS
ncbi:MAG: hypothetical protein OHK0015_14910 [Chloroflexi bacterium OHK40]